MDGVANERLLRHLKLGELRAVAEIARCGSILAASVALGTSQPALTRSLAAAEAKLGARLFERLARGVRPTLHGDAVIRRIAAVFSEIRAAAEDIAALDGVSRGKLSLGAMPLAAAGLVPEALQRLISGRPGLQVTVLEGHPEFLLRELRARHIEIVVGRLALAEGDRDLAKELLYNERLSVIAGSKHPLQRHRRLSLQDIAGESWLLPPPDTAFYRQVAQMFEMAGVDLPPHNVRTLSVPVSIGLATRTNAVAIVPRSILTLGYLSSDVRALPVRLPRTKGPVGFIRLIGASESPAMREFTACSRAVVAPIISAWKREAP